MESTHFDGKGVLKTIARIWLNLVKVFFTQLLKTPTITRHSKPSSDLLNALSYSNEIQLFRQMKKVHLTN